METTGCLPQGKWHPRRACLLPNTLFSFPIYGILPQLLGKLQHRQFPLTLMLILRSLGILFTQLLQPSLQWITLPFSWVLILLGWVEKMELWVIIKGIVKLKWWLSFGRSLYSNSTMNHIYIYMSYIDRAESMSHGDHFYPYLLHCPIVCEVWDCLKRDRVEKGWSLATSQVRLQDQQIDQVLWFIRWEYPHSSA